MRLKKSFRSAGILLIAVATLLLTAALLSSCNSESSKLNRQGNDAFAQQAFEEAWVAYEAAQIEAPEVAEPYYNAANALYRQGNYPEALAKLQDAISLTGDEALAQRAFFNMGNSLFNSQSTESAVAAYIESLLRNPDDVDAKVNLELALQQQEEQQEQEQENESENGSESEEAAEDDQSGDSESEEQQSQEQEGEEQSQEEPKNGSESPEEDAQSESQPAQPGEEEGDPQDNAPSQQPQPGQRMTEEQAQRLLRALTQDGQTLQEKLGEIFIGSSLPPVQDW